MADNARFQYIVYEEKSLPSLCSGSYIQDATVTETSEDGIEMPIDTRQVCFVLFPQPQSTNRSKEGLIAYQINLLTMIRLLGRNALGVESTIHVAGVPGHASGGARVPRPTTLAVGTDSCACASAGSGGGSLGGGSQGCAGASPSACARAGYRGVSVSRVDGAKLDVRVDDLGASS